MEALIIIFVLGGVIGLLLFMFFFSDGLLMVAGLEKLEYIAQMGVVFTPCAVMSNYEFGEPYTVQTWTITIGFMLGCLILTIFSRIGIEWIEDHADRKQIKRQKKNTQKIVNNLLGKKARKID